MTDEASLASLNSTAFASSEERRVGVPTHEAVLTGRLAASAGALFPPGPGRSSWLILEPQTGFGVPDVLIVRASATAVAAHQVRKLRIPTVSAARVLAASSHSAPGITRKYAQTLRTELARQGWTEATVRSAANVVTDSMAIEVKMQDAKRALQQLGKFRVSAHRAAICMPVETAHRASRTTLERFGAGLIVAEDSRIVWEMPARYQPLPEYRRLWLAELLIRAFESGSAYRLSAPRKRSIPEAKARTLPR